MLELLSPAGSPEAVVAAVQNGADAVYLGLGSFNARRGAKNFSDDEFEKALRYCRIRGCKVYLTLNTLVGDREIGTALELAERASALGADAILVQDLGMVSVLRAALPDIPLHASTQMSIHNLAGAEAAAEMGLSRVVLARELSLEQIKYITKRSPVETEIFVHGALCFCHSGQCYMSSLIGRRSGNRGMCAQPCRMEYSMGGRLEDSHPLSLKDSCLADRLGEIEDAGVKCVKIEGRMKRPEYVGIVTGIYSALIRDRRKPTQSELRTLEAAFSRQGFTQGYFDGDKKDMLGVRAEDDRADEKLFADARREYIGKEGGRVPIKLYAVANRDEAVRVAAEDDQGNRVFAFGSVPVKAIRRAVSSEAFSARLEKTGGTPYYCTEARSRVQDGLYVSAAEVNELRRKLISAMNDKRAAAPERRRLPAPPVPEGRGAVTDPKLIYQVTNAEQLTDELAATHPDYIYVPAELMLENFDLVRLFMDRAATPVAVLPRVVTDDENERLSKCLRRLFDLGVNEALVGNLGHVQIARKAGLKTRADFGMNVFNSYSMLMMRKMGFLSAAASFELRLAQIRDMAKCVDTELIAYGRLPLMVSEQDIISRALGAQQRGSAGLSDRRGSVFPVTLDGSGRSVIFNSRKLFMADKADELCGMGLWGIRLLFTTEGARECVQIAERYRGNGEFTPNDLTRGLYYRGVD